jgi:hypothetical protein
MLEENYKKCQNEIASIWLDLTKAIGTIQTDVAKLQQDMQKQNSIILGVQKEVTAALQDFAPKLYNLTFGKSCPVSSPPNPAAATSES